MKNKKIVIGLVILIALAVFFLIAFLLNQPEEAKMPTISKQPVSQEKEMTEDNQKIEEEKAQIEFRKKIETENIELGIEGIVNSIGQETISVTTLDGQDLDLSIIQERILESVSDTDGPVEINSEGKVVKKGTIFMKKNGDNLEEIKDFKLENMSQGQEIGITYMTLSKEVVQITLE